MATRFAEPEPWVRVSAVLAEAAGVDESRSFEAQAREVARGMRGIRFDWAGRPTCTWSAAEELLVSLKAEQAGWPIDGAGEVWADLPGARQVARGQPVDGGALSFHFPPGTAGYTELIGKPGLTAIVTMDIGTRRILGVRFLNRG